MNLLWLARTLPIPMDAGDRVYTNRTVTAIAESGFDVTFTGLLPSSIHNDRMAVELSDSISWKVIPGRPRSPAAALICNLPFGGVRYYTRAYKTLLSDILNSDRFDAVVIDHYGMSWALEYVRAQNRDAVIIHLAHDFETEVTEQIYSHFRGNAIYRELLRINAARTREVERKLACQCDLLIALTDRDAASFSRINTDLNTIVLPPGYSGRRTRIRTITSNTPRSVIIIGSFGWIAKQMNLTEFLNSCYEPLTTAKVQIKIVGNTPDDFRSGLINAFPKIRLLGFVDELNDEIQECRIGIVPERTGGGFKLKILDYIFHRIPVAALEQGLGGISDALKGQMLVATDFKALANTIVGTIDNIDLLNELQNNSLALADGQFDWRANGERLASQIKDVSRNGHGSAKLSRSQLV